MTTKPDSTRLARDLVSSAAAALKARIEEVNRLNVFPVPDGDTGINMSLTMDTVVREVASLPADATVADVCRAVSHGSLMGARGNSGVILSQILRGLCEEIAEAEKFDIDTLVASLERAVDVSYQAVRKPVEGTMLTVVRETAEAVAAARDATMPLEEALERVSEAAFESVRHTPELLPVLKENGVVDAGGLGLAILLEGFVSAALGRSVQVAEISAAEVEPLSVEPVDDWDDDEYLYCTEFLLFGPDIDRATIEEYVSAVGGSELVVGASGEYKVHVHTNDPGSVLSYVMQFGEVAEVHVNNMRRQSQHRDELLRAEESPAESTYTTAEKPTAPPKPIGFVAVAAGKGLAEILTSLGVDLIVNGGQTMNPSTEDLLQAIERVNANAVIVLPNNKNIVLAANAAASHANKPAAVVPTRSVPAAFSALLAVDGTTDIEALAEKMTQAADEVRTGEVTTAVKDATSSAGPIKTGQVIGIVDDKEIEVVGDEVDDVAIHLAERLVGDEAETLTLFAGADYSDEQLAALAGRIEEALPEIELETHRGEQPLYPLIMSAE